MPTVLVRFVSAETVHELPMPPLAYPILALAGFALLLAVLWSFRGTAQKVRDRDDGSGEHH